MSNCSLKKKNYAKPLRRKQYCFAQVQQPNVFSKEELLKTPDDLCANIAQQLITFVLPNTREEF